MVEAVVRVAHTYVLVLSACGRLGFDARTESSTDGAGVDTVVPLGAWSTPTPLILINTPDDESDPELRADGLELIFHSNRPGGVGGYDLYRSVRATTTDPFPVPTPIASLNTANDELGPGLSGDGLTLFFSDGQDIRFATRASVDADFGASQALPLLSSADVDTAPEISGDGRIAIIARGVVGTRDLWLYTRATDGPPDVGWSTGTQMIELASSVTDTSPDLDGHGLVVHFHSDRLGTTDDIFRATRASPDVAFDAPQTVPELTSAADEGDPTLSADQRIVVFHRGLDLFMSTR